jgi:NAD(P) transhydrogenase subunit alpha
MADAGVAAFAMELMPRITRAQVMDVLSSQANLAGYRAVIEAPPNMAAPSDDDDRGRHGAGGKGVRDGRRRRRPAGDRDRAPARRRRHRDRRAPATKEQVESLGAKFLAVEDEEFKNAETAGGYAKEMSKEYQAKQAALVAEHIKKQDIVITTALIPGRPAPRLVTPRW